MWKFTKAGSDTRLLVGERHFGPAQAVSPVRPRLEVDHRDPSVNRVTTLHPRTITLSVEASFRRARGGG